MSTRMPYPSDVSDEEWEFVAPYLTLLALDSQQRRHDLRAVFNAVRYLVHTSVPWRYLPSNFPPWPIVYQQARRWLAAGCFEALLHDLRLLLHMAHGRGPQPTAAIFDARVLQSSPRAGRALATVEPNDAMAPRSMWRSTRWVCCWRCA